MANKAGIGTASVHRAEAVDAAPDMRVATLTAIGAAMEAVGVRFIPGGVLRI
ncbi:MAG: hypothetical protein RIM84_21045 [Alphaproteobacteria bacterium]